MHGMKINAAKLRRIHAPLKSRYQIAKDSGIPMSTVYSWFGRGNLTGPQLELLQQFLRDGLGLSEQQIANLSVGEVFDLE